MPQIDSLFVTRLYRAALSEHGAISADELEASCFAIATDDEAGQQWCEDNDFPAIRPMRPSRTFHGAFRSLRIW